MLLAVIFLLGQLVNPQPAMAKVGSVPNNEGQTSADTEAGPEGKPVEVSLNSEKQKKEQKDIIVSRQLTAASVIARDHIQQLAISIAVATGKGPEMLMRL
ncbi:MAG: hypothetical protein LBJ77_02260 [Holosporales bacterium]|jgi:hypothetical protein|nr:hypothetical protein [Holosporales bacterium]